jgi:NTP pyrophosphatase (non-canonical NTP hydrolase)
MELTKLIESAQAIRQEYSLLEKEQYRREWSGEELMHGYMKDVGDSAKLEQTKEGIRDLDDANKKLAHKLSDCLWSIIVLSDHYNVDLEAGFMQTM